MGVGFEVVDRLLPVGSEDVTGVACEPLVDLWICDSATGTVTRHSRAEGARGSHWSITLNRAQCVVHSLAPRAARTDNISKSCLNRSR